MGTMQFLYKAGAAFGSIRNCVELLHTSSSGLVCIVRLVCKQPAIFHTSSRLVKNMLSIRH